MTKEHAITTAKQFRVDADALLQRMKHHLAQPLDAKEDGLTGESIYDLDNLDDYLRHQQLSIDDLESCIMRQGMVLKAIGNPNPYPDSYKPENTVVNPTADGLKM